ncbi:MAG: WXG100 family type VII secretion target [Leucobacter sp.]
MANINLSYDEMESVAAELGAGREEIVSRLNGLQQRIHGLVATGFVTESASQRFEATYTDYSANARGVIENLTELEQFIHQAAMAHREMDTALAARLG